VRTQALLQCVVSHCTTDGNSLHQICSRLLYDVLLLWAASHRQAVSIGADPSEIGICPAPPAV